MTQKPAARRRFPARIGALFGALLGTLFVFIDFGSSLTVTQALLCRSECSTTASLMGAAIGLVAAVACGASVALFWDAMKNIDRSNAPERYLFGFWLAHALITGFVTSVVYAAISLLEPSLLMNAYDGRPRPATVMAGIAALGVGITVASSVLLVADYIRRLFRRAAARSRLRKRRHEQRIAYIVGESKRWREPEVDEDFD